MFFLEGLFGGGSFGVVPRACSFREGVTELFEGEGGVLGRDLGAFPERQFRGEFFGCCGDSFRTSFLRVLFWAGRFGGCCWEGARDLAGARGPRERSGGGGRGPLPQAGPGAARPRSQPGEEPLSGTVPAATRRRRSLWDPSRDVLRYEPGTGRGGPAKTGDGTTGEGSSGTRGPRRDVGTGQDGNSGKGLGDRGRIQELGRDGPP